MLFLSRIDFPNMTENMGRKVKKKKKKLLHIFCAVVEVYIMAPHASV